ncbi:MAG: orotate phosphoribosyltransferase [Promethearchaeota archaeon]
MAIEDMKTKKKVSEILLNINAVVVSTTEPFQYASGILSPIYTKCRVLLSYPKERKIIIDFMIKKISSFKKEIDVIASAGTSSTFLASLLTQYLNLPMVFIRPRRKKHGKKKEIEGEFQPGSKVLLVSDIFSTEEDIPNSVDTIQRNGGVITYCLAVFDNKISKIPSFLKNKGIPYATLTDLTTLLEIAFENGQITPEEKNAVEEWTKDPEIWNKLRMGKVKVKDHTKHFKKLSKIESEKIEKLLEENNRKLNLYGNVEKLLNHNKREIARILLKIKASTINTAEPFRYTSGILSPIYTDNRLLISHPEEWNYIINSFVDVIINRIGLQNFDILSGIAISGIPHATLISERLGLPLVYVKSEENKGSYIEGRLSEDIRAIMIEDHISTGKSSLESVKVLRENGVHVDWCVAIFSYNLKKAKKAFDDEKVKLLTLCDIASLMDIAIEMKYIKPEDREIVNDWLNDPESWEFNR